MTRTKGFDDVLRRAQENDATQTLQRTLGPAELIVIGIGGIIGAGIFVATGAVAAHHTGPAIVFSFALAAAGCLCAGLCYAEFAAMVPVSGSAYSYVRATFGQATGWMIGWCLVIEYLMAGATVAAGWSGYFVALLSSLGVEISAAFTSPPFTVSSGQWVHTGAVLNAPAIALLAVLTALSLGGVRLSVRATGLLVAVKLGVIALFICVGAFFVDPANWRPFLPPNGGEFGEFGWSGVMRGAGAIFYAFLGFDAVSTAARETRNPQRSVPAGIIGSLAIVTVIYIAFSLVLTGLASYTLLAVPSPVSAALDHAGSQLLFLKVALEIGALVGLTSVLLVILYGLSRILYAVAQDGLLPAAFGRIGRRTKAPYAAIVACGVAAAIAAGLFPVDLLGQLISIGTLSAFVFVCGGVLALRITAPGIERPFRIAFAPLVCGAGVLICGYLMFSLPSTTWRQFLMWLLLGTAVYWTYGRRRAARLRSTGEQVCGARIGCKETSA